MRRGFVNIFFLCNRAHLYFATITTATARFREVEFESFNIVLRKICANIPPGGKFYDIGSGSGRAVFVARITQDFETCIGIELMENLATLASQMKQKYDTAVKDLLHSSQNCSDVEFFCDDFLEFDWTDGDVVFANSTCFTDSLMESISRKASAMNPGSFLVTFTKGIVSEHFEVVGKKRYNMSWGPATVFIHRRLGENGESFGPADLTSYTASPPEAPSSAKSHNDHVEIPRESTALGASGPLEITGTAATLHVTDDPALLADTIQDQNGDVHDYIGDDDIDSGYYSSSNAGSGNEEGDDEEEDEGEDEGEDEDEDEGEDSWLLLYRY